MKKVITTPVTNTGRQKIQNGPSHLPIAADDKNLNTISNGSFQVLNPLTGAVNAGGINPMKRVTLFPGISSAAGVVSATNQAAGGALSMNVVSGGAVAVNPAASPMAAELNNMEPYLSAPDVMPRPKSKENEVSDNKDAGVKRTGRKGAKKKKQ